MRYITTVSTNDSRSAVKKTLVLLIMLVTLSAALLGCSSHKNKEVTYSELDAEGQAVVDTVYNNYDSWEIVKEHSCTNVGFFYDEDENVLVFAAYYTTGETETGRTAGGAAVSSVKGFYAYATVDTNTGKLTAYTGTESLWALCVTEQVWDVSADSETQKDILANKYAVYLSSQASKS